MAIRIERVGGKYSAVVTPPHGRSTSWRTTEPLILTDLIDALSRRGCHQTDIGDALYEADPEWVLRMESRGPS
jgi:hypothetical protein